MCETGGIAKRGENRHKKGGGGVEIKTTNLRVADPSKLLKKVRVHTRPPPTLDFQEHVS